MREIHTQALDREAFRPYGDFIDGYKRQAIISSNKYSLHTKYYSSHYKH